MGELGKEDIEVIKRRLDEIDKKLDQFATVSRYNRLSGLSVAAILSGLGLIASGGSYVFDGKILGITGLAMLLLIPATWSGNCVYQRVGYILAVVCVLMFLSLAFFEADPSFTRVASWAIGLPGVLLMVVGLFRLHRR